MLSLTQIESDLTTALKARDAIKTNTLRALKVRLQNQKISKMAELSDEDIVSLIKSEIKKRKEAAEAFTGASRTEQAEQEMAEAKILEVYLPEQLSEADMEKMVDAELATGSYTAKDFGQVMGKLKAQVGQTGDGAVLAKILKNKLK